MYKLEEIEYWSGIGTALDMAQKLPRKAPKAQLIKRCARRLKHHAPGKGAPKVETILAAVQSSQAAYDASRRRPKPARRR